MTDDILVAQGLQKCYRLGGQELAVLKGVDVRVRRGEILSIAGASGAGKSTLLHLLGALDTPSDGTVFLDGVSLFGLSVAKRAALRNSKIGFIFQAYHLLPELSALENVMLPFLIGRKDKPSGPGEARAKELLRKVGLGERLEHRPVELSGGEQQRVAIARALVNCPTIVFADEPTGNLDSKTGDTVMQLLMELHHAQNLTLVIVTHDEHVAKYGERRLEITDGKIQS
jgi:putative ABC transport system ATP-binding protein/lipoprotein-releasing system ATP-binding protein